MPPFDGGMLLGGMPPELWRQVFGILQEQGDTERLKCLRSVNSAFNSVASALLFHEIEIDLSLGAHLKRVKDSLSPSSLELYRKSRFFTYPRNLRLLFSGQDNDCDQNEAHRVVTSFLPGLLDQFSNLRSLRFLVAGDVEPMVDLWNDRLDEIMPEIGKLVSHRGEGVATSAVFNPAMPFSAVKYFGNLREFDTTWQGRLTCREYHDIIAPVLEKSPLLEKLAFVDAESVSDEIFASVREDSILRSLKIVTIHPTWRFTRAGRLGSLKELIIENERPTSLESLDEMWRSLRDPGARLRTLDVNHFCAGQLEYLESNLSNNMNTLILRIPPVPSPETPLEEVKDLSDLFWTRCLPKLIAGGALEHLHICPVLQALNRNEEPDSTKHRSLWSIGPDGQRLQNITTAGNLKKLTLMANNDDAREYNDSSWVLDVLPALSKLLAKSEKLTCATLYVVYHYGTVQWMWEQVVQSAERITSLTLPSESGTMRDGITLCLDHRLRMDREYLENIWRFDNASEFVSRSNTWVAIDNSS